MKRVSQLIREIVMVFRGDAILIYTMGKVGSSSVKYSLEQIGVPVVHLHNFDGEQYVFFGRKLENGQTILSVFLMKVRLQLIGLAFRFSRKSKVITLVRDPVARNVSILFQALDRLISRGIRESGTDQREALQYIFEHFVNHDIPMDWFQREFEKHTGINIIDHDANGRDFLLIKQKRIEVLVLKLEALNSMEKEISKFIGRSDFKLRRANIGGGKWYAELYDNFKADVRLDPAYFDRMYSAPFVAHLYSNSEVEKFRAHWAANTAERS